jgi:protein-tyrosine phosphatase
MSHTAQHKLLFVCMGNICRSPAAEGIMQHLVTKAGRTAEFHIDSAGTGGWHAGDLADPRMRSAAKARGYTLTHRARQVNRQDFEHYDLILIMDAQNQRDLKPWDPKGLFSDKVQLLTTYCQHNKTDAVPDPYYGDAKDFEQVIDLLEDACAGLLCRF